MTIDLTEDQGVTSYLASTPFCASVVQRLLGGSGNYTFRITLKSPYRGHSTAVLKHAEGHVASIPSLPFSLDRFDFEHSALKMVSRAPFLASTPEIRIPQILLLDEVNHVLILEDAGNIPSVKEFFSTNPSSVPLATRIGSALGVFLANLHNWGSGNLEMEKEFSSNKTARAMCAWRTAGRLVETASQFGIPTAVDLEEVAEGLRTQVEISKHSFNMGDYWTGNVLVDADPETSILRSLFIIDWELAKYGPASTDIGQFAAESHLLARFLSPQAGSTLLSSFLSNYRRTIDASVGVDYPDVACQMGAHIAVWGAINWGPQEQVKEVVLEGFKLVETGWLKDMQTLASSPVKDLLLRES